jgi:pimeloyl-ACP methyl ester carboxylesterase
MKRIGWRVPAAILLVLPVIGLAVGIVLWMQNALGPSDVALDALQSSDRVEVDQQAGLLTFGWEGVESSTGFIFYPGAGVDYRSYAPVLRMIAENGYFIVVVPMPLNLAFFNGNGADQVVTQYPEVEHWVIGGHSLGGLAAAGYAANHPVIEGIALWASHPADEALKARDIKAISIYGSADGLVTVSQIEESRASLPADTVFVEIDGGNHSQFGSYGQQEYDRPASISPEEQWTRIAAAMESFLASFDD